jgi:hypothetical protein
MRFDQIVEQILEQNLGRAYRQTKKYLDTTDSKYPVPARDAYDFYKTAQNRANRIVTKQGQIPVTHVIFLDRLKDNRSLSDIINRLTSKGEEEISVSILKSWDDWERGFNKVASSVMDRNVPTFKPRIVLKGTASNVHEWYPTDAYTTSDPVEKTVAYPSMRDLNKSQRSGYDEAVVKLKDVKWNSFEVIEPDQKYFSGQDKWNNQQAFNEIKQEIEIGTKQLAAKGLKNVSPGLATRITTGSDEVRDILKNKKVKSKLAWGGKGDTYFVDGSEPKQRYMPQTISSAKPGEKLGYVLRADGSKLQNPVSNIHNTIFSHLPEDEGLRAARDYYAKKGYKTLPANSPASDIKTIQRIIKDPNTGNYEFKQERDFGRFQQIYNRLMKAFEEGRIQVRPPKINPTMGAAGVAALMQFMNDEVPPDIRNSMLAQRGGGLGIVGKFTATP